MNEEEMITTYKEFEEAIKNGERKLVKGMGRLQTYLGLEYIKELLGNDKYYCEELEDSFVAISAYIDSKEEEINKLKEVIEEIRDNILNETTTFCKFCTSKDCCYEEACVLYRIEKNIR